MDIRLKRAYERPATNDGMRVLVDRIWPRGVSKEDARVDMWLKQIAPSRQLRKWFGHDPEKWSEFRKKYFEELQQKDDELSPLREKLKNGRVTLVYGSKEQRYNNAVALKEYLQSG